MLAINITNKIVNSEYLSGGLKSCPSSLQGSIANQLHASHFPLVVAQRKLASLCFLDNAASSAGLLITAVHRN
jgi:hypothetical protein